MHCDTMGKKPAQVKDKKKSKYGSGHKPINKKLPAIDTY